MAHEVKATRLDILKLIKAKEVVEIGDLVERFGYAFEGARKKLYRLEKVKLVDKMGNHPGTYCLTNEGHRRIAFYEQRR